MDLNIAGKLPCAFERIGRQWGTIPGKQKGVHTYEIDVVHLSVIGLPMRGLIQQGSNRQNE